MLFDKNWTVQILFYDTFILQCQWLLFESVWDYINGRMLNQLGVLTLKVLVTTIDALGHF